MCFPSEMAERILRPPVPMNVAVVNVRSDGRAGQRSVEIPTPDESIQPKLIRLPRLYDESLGLLLLRNLLEQPETRRQRGQRPVLVVVCENGAV
jgi:hypothetical protein